MKIDKRRPTHWLYLVLFLLQGALGLGLRRLFKTTAIRDCKAVILYGHKLNGNLLALYRAMEADYRHQLRPVFVTMDPAYHRTLKAAGIRSQWACGIDCAVLLSQAAAPIRGHGLHSFAPLHNIERTGQRLN